jgi:hypothetical protein
MTAEEVSDNLAHFLLNLRSTSCVERRKTIRDSIDTKTIRLRTRAPAEDDIFEITIKRVRR